jgi:hypothetical protein
VCSSDLLLTGLDAPVKGDLPAPEITSSAADEIKSTKEAKALSQT